VAFFTVIIPTFNRRVTLLETIRSVQVQTFRDFDCWIIDDASTDGSWDLLQSLALDSRFHLERNATNRKQHYSRNRVIERSQSPWITFLDSDDLWLPTRLERFVEAIHAHPEVRFLFSNGSWLREGKIIGQFFDEKRSIPTGVVPGYYAVGATHLPYVTTNVAIDRRCFETVGLYREDMEILEDTELYARMLAAGAPVGVIHEKLSLYRLHAGQITRRYRTQFEESLIALRSAETPAAIYKKRREELLRDTTLFFLKAAAPSDARQLLKEQHARLRYPGLWLLTWIPATLIRLVRTVISQ